MKNSLLYIGVLLLLSLVGCAPKTEYTHALPKDASLVVALDVQTIAQKSGLEGKNSEKITSKLTELLKGGLEGEAALMAEKIVNEPSESGLDFGEKVYLFATPHANVIGALCKVNSESRIEEWVDALVKEGICTSLKEESGCQWTQMGKMLCAFNNGTFLLLSHKSGDVESIQGTLLSLMRQQEGEGYAAMPEFVQLKETGNDVASTLDLSILPDRWTTPLRMGLTADIRLQDIKYLMTVNFEQGKVKMQATSLTQNPKVQSFFKQMDAVTSTIQGKYMEYFPGNTLAWTGGRIQGKAFYEMICQNPTIRQIMRNPILPVDMERIFSAIEGDYGMGYLSAATDEFLVYGDVTNVDFLETFEDLRPLLAMTGGEVKLHDMAENQYALQTYDAVYWFGVKKNFFYVTNRRELAEEAGRTYGVSVGTRPWAAEAKSNRLCATMNLAKLRTDINEHPYLLVPLGNKQAVAVFKSLMDEYDSINVFMPDWTQIRMEVQMKDKKSHPLKQLIQLVENL